MFLSSTNKIKWNKIIAGAIVTALLVVLCVLWFDIPLHYYFHAHDNIAWDTFSEIFGSKIWVFVAAPLLLISAILKYKIGKAKIGKIKIWDFIKNIKTRFFEFVKWLNFKNPGLDRAGGIKHFIASQIARVSFMVLGAVVVESIIVGALKFCFGRMRPAFLESGQYGFFPFNLDWAFNSMPSGHTAASFAGLVTIGMMFPRVKWLTWTIAIAVGFSRVFVGDHFPADVIFGAFIGCVVADVVRARVFRVES